MLNKNVELLHTRGVDSDAAPIRDAIRALSSVPNGVITKPSDYSIVPKTA
jgi:hypothetical protein